MPHFLLLGAAAQNNQLLQQHEWLTHCCSDPCRYFSPSLSGQIRACPGTFMGTGLVAKPVSSPPSMCKKKHKDSSLSLLEKESPAHSVLFSNLRFSLSSSSPHNGLDAYRMLSPCWYAASHDGCRACSCGQLLLGCEPVWLQLGMGAVELQEISQPPPSLLPTGIILHHPSSAPHPLGSYGEEGWRLTFHSGEQRRSSPPGSLEDRHICPGLRLSHVVHPLGRRLRHTAL